MGNKQNGRPPAPIRAHSTTTPPTAAAAATVGSSNQQLASAAGAHHHHRISRRRSEFQQGSRRQQSDNNSMAAAGTVNNSSAGSSTTNQQLYSSGGSGGGNNTLAPATDRAVVVINHPPNSNSSTETERERTRQNRRRWSSAANVHPRANQQVVKPKRMSPRQCHLVIKAWSRRAPKSRVVKDIFAAIFTEAEELKSAFGIETSSVGKRLRTDTNFLQHTNMFADTLDFVIRNLDDLSLVTENAEQLGRRHAGFPLENGFRPEYWSIFTECIVDGVCTGEEDKETQIAWRQLVQTIVYYMKLGYDREMLRITRHSSFRRSNSPMTRGRVQQDRPSSSSGLSSVTLDEQRLLLLRPAEEKMPPAANDCRKTIGYHRDHYQ